MKQKLILLAMTALLLVSLACNALMGGGKDAPSQPGSNDTSPAEEATQDSSTTESGGGDVSKSGFVLTADAYNITEISSDSILFYTKMPPSDLLKFYRDEYVSRGYTERELLTVESDGVFSIVFDGDPSGKAVIVQSVDLSDGSSTVSITLQDI